MTFVQEQKSLRTDYYTSPESFKRFGEGRCKRATSTMESPLRFTCRNGTVEFVILLRGRRFGDERSLLSFELLFTSVSFCSFTFKSCFRFLLFFPCCSELQLDND